MSSAPAAGRPNTRSVRRFTYSTEASAEVSTPSLIRFLTSERLSLTVTVSSLKFGESGCLSTSTRTLGRMLVGAGDPAGDAGPQPLTFALTVASDVFLPLWP